jgi:sugar phosphate permease
MFLQQSLGKTTKEIADIQTCYEIGAIIGSILLGYLTDQFYRRSPVILGSTITAALISFVITFSYHS